MRRNEMEYSFTRSSLVLRSWMTPSVLLPERIGMQAMERILSSGWAREKACHWVSRETSGTTRGLPVEATHPATPSPSGTRRPFRLCESSPTAMA